MQKHTARTIAIWISIVLAIIWIYPTIGWYSLSTEEQQARIERWNTEDEVYKEPSVFGDMAKGVRRWAQFDVGRVITLGLDLQGGVHMVLGLDTEQLAEQDWARLAERFGARPTDKEYIVEQLQNVALTTVQRRIDEFEAQEPLITKMGTSQIQVQLPGEKDIKRAQELIMKTAYLTFQIVAGPEQTTQVFKAIEQKFPERFLPFLRRSQYRAVVPEDNIDKVRQVVAEAEEIPGLIPADKKILFGPPPRPWETEKVYQIYLVDREPIMTGEGLEMAAAIPDDRNPPNWKILFGWDAENASKFGKVTQANLKKSMAIVLDNVAYSAPVIQSQITRSGEVTGSFGQQEALDLAIALNSGSMPVPVKEDYAGYVGATLGSDSVWRGVLSALIGIVLVIIITAWYYRIPGLIADIGLILNGLMLLAVMAYINATLTLPGIAGLILTIGMAVDANVLVFERMREERRNGRSLLATIDLGYSRATVTVMDSNITTLIAAVVLLQFGTGPIKGFAVTLSLGILTSVYTALIVTRAIFDFLTRRDLISDVKMMSLIPHDTKIGFMSKRFHCFVISALLIGVGLTAFVYRQIYGPNNFGVDFTTGTNVVVRLETDQPVGVGDLRKAIGDKQFPDLRVQEYMSEMGEANLNRFLVHVGSSDGDPAAPATPAAGAGAAGAASETESARVVAAVQQALAPLVGGDPAKVVNESVESVGPAVGMELIRQAIWAVLSSMFFITLFLWFRYELRFALATILALFHDVLITLGLFALFGRQINMGVVAAILTVVGYSLNDTVVVFDRVREDLKLYRGRGYTLLQILDRAVNETLSRTMLTSPLTLLVVAVLFIYGGEVLRDFAFVLIVGIIFGTYSSVYIASPIAYYLQRFHIRRTFGRTPTVEVGTRRRKRQKPAPTEGEATV